MIRSVERLPFEQARAMWLIDVCGLTYAEAATELGLARTEIARTVGSARRRVRAELHFPPA